MMKSIILDLRDFSNNYFFEKRNYSIWILGGFGITMNDFQFKIIDNQNNKISVKEVFLKQQDYKKGIRAKKIYEF